MTEVEKLARTIRRFRDRGFSDAKISLVLGKSPATLRAVEDAAARDALRGATAGHPRNFLAVA